MAPHFRISLHLNYSSKLGKTFKFYENRITISTISGLIYKLYVDNMLTTLQVDLEFPKLMVLSLHKLVHMYFYMLSIGQLELTCCL